MNWTPENGLMAMDGTVSEQAERQGGHLLGKTGRTGRSVGIATVLGSFSARGGLDRSQVCLGCLGILPQVSRCPLPLVRWGRHAPALTAHIFGFAVFVSAFAPKV
ncbi:MAG: hypothetical protein F6K28_41160 [Microcoleus sp. SIO2G3]|nr:hypothetical protein [Microcoleus sp. SIO2G3]